MLFTYVINPSTQHRQHYYLQLGGLEESRLVIVRCESLRDDLDPAVPLRGETILPVAPGGVPEPLDGTPVELPPGD